MNKRNLTVAQLMDESILGKFFLFLNVRARSVTAYRYNLKLFFGYLAGQNVTQPEREHVFAYRDALIEAGKKPATVHAYIIAVRVFFRWTAHEGLYENIAEYVKAPSPGHGHRRDALSARQVKTVLNAIDRSSFMGIRNYAMVALMVIGGLRCIEVSRAKVGDVVKLERDTVLHVQGKGQGESADYVKLPHYAQRALRAYLTARGRVEKDAPLFASMGNRNRNGPLSTRIISRIVKTILCKAGYDSDRLCAHSLRHTAVTLALKGGESLEAVKEFARHTDVNTTLVYSHAVDREHCTCGRTIERSIFGVRKRRKRAKTPRS